MAWRRKRNKNTTPPGGSTEWSSADGPTGDVSVPGDMLTDDVVLGELSRVFATEAEVDGIDVEPVTGSDGGSDTGSDGDWAGDRAGDSDGDSWTVVSRTPTDPASQRATISIIGDDLPDAAYLDDELDSDVSGVQPVFIDDDGRSDAVFPRDNSTRGIEPRIRQRRIGVKRSENRRRLWWLALGAVVLLIVIAALALLGSSLFAVDQVTVTGNVYTDQTALDAVIDDLTGTPVLLVDIGDVQARIEDIAWVDSARVRTSFPDSASIEIRERTPVAAMMGADGQARVIDVDGRVLALVDGQPVALVWISGPGTLDVVPGQFASIGYSSAASLVTKLTPDIRGRVESMLVTPDGSDLVLVLTSESGPIEVRFGSAIGENAQIEKLVRLQRTLDDLDEGTVTVIDVSTSQVTVR
jgi:cell division protein FtsQ